MTINLTNEQKVKVTLAPTTAAGNPAQVENPVFTVTSGDATLEDDETGDVNSKWIVSGAEGASTIDVTADADLGEGVNNISETIDVSVAQAGASAIGLSIGEPVLK